MKRWRDMQWWRGMERWQQWALAGGGALVVGIIVAVALAAFWPSGPPIGKEVARHTHEGEAYTLVKYGNKVALFSSSGTPVTRRSLAEDVLHSYAWRQVVTDLDTEELADVSQKVQRLDDSVSGLRRLSNFVVGIFDKLDDMKVNLPLVGSISAMDVIRDLFEAVEYAEILIRKLDSELNALGDNAASLSRVSEKIVGNELSSVSGDEMESLFADASGAAVDVEGFVRNVQEFISDVRELVGDLERALRSGSNTPIIGDVLLGFAESVGRFGERLSGLARLLGGFASELGALAKDMEKGLESAEKTLQADMNRWLEESYDTKWPPTDPERRPAE